jgi:hypothetical protein
MYVLIKVSPKAAVLAGKSKSGVQRLELTEGALAELTEAQRNRLASSRALCATIDCCALDNLELPDASLDSLKLALDALIATEAKKAENERQCAERIRQETEEVLRERKTRSQIAYRGNPTVRVTEVSPAWPYQYDHDIVRSPEAQAWKAEIEAQNQHEIEVAQAQHADRERKEAEKQEAENRQQAQYTEALLVAVCEWSPDDANRAKAGLMPEKEMENLVRDHLFAGITTDRYVRLVSSDVDHREYCEGLVAYFDVDEAESVSAEQWAALQVIRTQIGDGMCVTPRRHTATCESCDEHCDRMSARVTADWHGHTFSREYAI